MPRRSIKIYSYLCGKDWLQSSALCTRCKGRLKKIIIIIFNVKLDNFAEQSRINVRIKILVILKANCFHEILELFVQLKLKHEIILTYTS